MGNGRAKPGETQRKIIKAFEVSEEKGLTQGDLNRIAGSRQLAHYTVKVLKERGDIIKGGDRFIWIGEKNVVRKAIQNLREKFYYLRDPTIEEIAVEVGKPPTEIERDVYEMANEIYWSEPSENDLLETNKWIAHHRFLFEIAKGIYEGRIKSSFLHRNKIITFDKYTREYNRKLTNRADWEWFANQDRNRKEQGYEGVWVRLMKSVHDELVKIGFLNTELGLLMDIAIKLNTGYEIDPTQRSVIISRRLRELEK